jgi:hypothetical protein
MVGAMLVAGAAMCASGASRAAPTIGGFLDAAGFALAAEGDGGFSLAPTAGEWFPADGLAIPDDDGFAGGPSADGIEASSTERATAATTADFASGASGDGVLTGGLADWIGFDTARMPAPLADFPTGSSGVFVSPIEDLPWRRPTQMRRRLRPPPTISWSKIRFRRWWHSAFWRRACWRWGSCAAAAAPPRRGASNWVSTRGGVRSAGNRIQGSPMGSPVAVSPAGITGRGHWRVAGLDWQKRDCTSRNGLVLQGSRRVRRRAP